VPAVRPGLVVVDGLRRGWRGECDRGGREGDRGGDRGERSDPRARASDGPCEHSTLPCVDRTKLSPRECPDHAPGSGLERRMDSKRWAPLTRTVCPLRTTPQLQTA